MLPDLAGHRGGLLLGVVVGDPEEYHQAGGVDGAGDLVVDRDAGPRYSLDDRSHAEILPVVVGSAGELSYEV
jgi:hypothetical protein